MFNNYEKCDVTNIYIMLHFIYFSVKFVLISVELRASNEIFVYFYWHVALIFNMGQGPTSCTCQWSGYSGVGNYGWCKRISCNLE